MALMKHREPNRVKWIGARPGHNGTQVLKHVAVANGTSILHTVTAGKTLFLAEWIISNTAGAAGTAALFIRDAADAMVRYLGHIAMNAAGNTISDHGNAYPPIEIPAGFDVCVISNAVAISADGGIYGWEE